MMNRWMLNVAVMGILGALAISSALVSASETEQVSQVKIKLSYLPGPGERALTMGSVRGVVTRDLIDLGDQRIPLRFDRLQSRDNENIITPLDNEEVTVNGYRLTFSDRDLLDLVFAANDRFFRSHQHKEAVQDLARRCVNVPSRCKVRTSAVPLEPGLYEIEFYRMDVRVSVLFVPLREKTTKQKKDFIELEDKDTGARLRLSFRVDAVELPQN